MQQREHIAPEVAAQESPRETLPTVLGAPRALSVARVLALQGTAGNHSVAALLSSGRGAAIRRCPDCGGTCGGTCVQEQQELEDDEEREQAEQAGLRAKSLGGADEPASMAPSADGFTIIDDVESEAGPAEHEEAEDGKTEAEGARAKRAIVDVEQVAPAALRDESAADLRAKATTAVRGGAAASQALGAGVYGLTWEESIDISVTAKKLGNTWKPVVNKLTGRFSQQTRLLPGQTEVTGPAGNTTQANYCQQVTGLNTLGNTVGNPWYMLRAVKDHEDVHAAHFGPGLAAAEPTITATIEAVSIPHTAGMNATTALAALKADGNFQAAAAAARGIWVARDTVLLAGDHAPGGPCDVAEHAVVDPMVNRICAHAKKQGWAACPVCPP